MRNITFLLACISLISHGRREQISTQRGGRLLEERGENLKMVNPLRALAVLLLSDDPTAAFTLQSSLAQASSGNPGLHSSHARAFDRESRLSDRAPSMGFIEDLKKNEFVKASATAVEDLKKNEFVKVSASAFKASATAVEGLKNASTAVADDLSKNEFLRASVTAVEVEWRKYLIQNEIVDPNQFKEEEEVWVDPDKRIPDSYEASLRDLQQGLQTAIEDGRRRIIVEYDQDSGDETYPKISRTIQVMEPMLQIMQDVAAPLEPGVNVLATQDTEGKPLPPRWQIIFPDQGTVSYLQNNWEFPSRTAFSSMSYSLFKVAPGCQAVLLVAPQAQDLEFCKKLMEEIDTNAPDTTLIIMNPEFVDFGTTALGAIGRSAKRMIEEQFEVAYAFNCLNPYGAVYRTYPGPWTVWRVNETIKERFTATYSQPTRPFTGSLLGLMSPDEEEGSGFFYELGQFVKQFSAL